MRLNFIVLLLVVLFPSNSIAQTWQRYWSDGGGDRFIDTDSIRQISPTEVSYNFLYANATASRSAYITANCATPSRAEAGEIRVQVTQGSPQEREVILACTLAVQPRRSGPVTPRQSTDQSPPQPQIKSTGTGFVINDQGDILTNYHVVEGCSSLAFYLKGKPYEGVLTSYDTQLDLAVIRSQKMTGLPYLRLSVAPVQLAQPVVVLGYPLVGVLGLDPRVTTGIISSISGIQGDRKVMQISAAVQPGNSGGPVVDQMGRVVGVVNSRLADRFKAENVNFAIKAIITRGFLEVNGIVATPPLATSKPLSVEETAAMMSLSTGIVICQ